MSPQFEPDPRLDIGDRVLLAQMVAMPGYKVFNRICRAEVDKFVINLVNCDPARPEEVQAAHLLAKAAAQFFQGITNTVNEEILQYTAAPHVGDTPIDVTEGVLDIADYMRYGRDVWED